MATIKPFRAIRPGPKRAAEVAAVPYDVVNTEEARALAAGNPLSFLRVSRPEIEMPEGVNVYADGGLRQSRGQFRPADRAGAAYRRERTAVLYLSPGDGGARADRHGRALLR